MLATKFGNLMKDGQMQQRGDPVYVKCVPWSSCSASDGSADGTVWSHPAVGIYK